MWRLTRGVTLRWDMGDHRLSLERKQRFNLAQRPLLVWVTMGDACRTDSGMIVNVVEINLALAQALRERQLRPNHAVEVIDGVWEALSAKFQDLKVLRVSLDIDDTLRLARAAEDRDMIQVTAKYEFAASHRLWNDAWDGQRNYEVFGKCSNEAGHGHNYLFEITLRGKPDPQTGEVVDLQQVDDVVDRQILKRFDHKNLNRDTAEFAELIPTVENMCKVFWELLIGRFGDAQLCRVAVWETPKTYAEYFGPEAGPLRYGEMV